jgi:hypothetical protein
VASRLNWSNAGGGGGVSGNILAAAAVRPENLPPATDRDKSTLKVHLPNGGFNVVKFGDATDMKVRE